MFSSLSLSLSLSRSFSGPYLLALNLCAIYIFLFFILLLFHSMFFAMIKQKKNWRKKCVRFFFYSWFFFQLFKIEKKALIGKRVKKANKTKGVYRAVNFQIKWNKWNSLLEMTKGKKKHRKILKKCVTTKNILLYYM